MSVLEGGCLCGAVRYEAQGLSGPIVHCHCETCRKARGRRLGTLDSARGSPARDRVRRAGAAR